MKKLLRLVLFNIVVLSYCFISIYLFSVILFNSKNSLLFISYMFE